MSPGCPGSGRPEVARQALGDGVRTNHRCGGRAVREPAHASEARHLRWRYGRQPRIRRSGPLRTLDRPPFGGVLRPRQDDHRQVELPGVQQAVPGRRPDHPRRDAALGVRPVRLPRRRRRPRPDGEDPGVHVSARRGLGRRDRQGDRRRDAAPRRRPDRVRRSRLADGGAPRRSAATSWSSPPAGPRSSSRSASCSAPTTSSPAGSRSSTASTPARSSTTRTPRRRRARSRRWRPSVATTSSSASPTATRSPTPRCSSVVGHPHAVNPDKELRKLAASKGWPILQFTRPVTLRSRIPVKPTLAALTVGTALTLGGAFWLNRRRAPSSAPEPAADTRAQGGGRKSRVAASAGPAYTERYISRPHANRVPTRRSTLPTGRTSSGNSRGCYENLHAW